MGGYNGELFGSCEFSFGVLVVVFEGVGGGVDVLVEF